MEPTVENYPHLSQAQIDFRLKYGKPLDYNHDTDPIILENRRLKDYAYTNGIPWHWEEVGDGSGRRRVVYK